MENKDDLHIAEQKGLEMLKEGLTDAKLMEQLEHLLECEACLDAFSDALTSEGLEEMPAYLEEEILASIYMGHENRTEAKSLAGVQSQKSRPVIWLQLLGYSTKIGFAAACAILMLFHLPDLSREAERPSLSNVSNRQEHRRDEERARQQKSYVADALEYITSKIFDGGIENDQEKE